MTSIIKNCSSLRVSSVLNKNAKEFGKQYMIDDCDDTCWNSDQGSPQWVEVNFPLPVTVEEVHIQFQGGFAGKECWVEAKSDGELRRISSIYPDDSNALQYLPYHLPYLIVLELCLIAAQTSLVELSFTI